MNTYLLYDPALNGAYTQLILQEQYPVNASLFAGTKDEVLDDVSPILFQIDQSFAEKVLQKPLIELQAVTFWLSDLKIESVATHLRQYIYQKLKGRQYYFRFWDARVLSKFLPTCSKEQILNFFEGLQSLAMIDEGNTALQYKQDRGKLFRIAVSADTLYGKMGETKPVEPGVPTQPDTPFVKTEKRGEPFYSFQTFPGAS